MTDPQQDQPPLFPGSTPIDTIAPILRDLARHLGEARYERTRTLPLAGGPQHLPLDIGNLRCALSGRSNLLHRSAVPWLYGLLLCGRTHHGVALHRAFHLCREMTRDEAKTLVGESLATRLLDAGVLETTATGVRSRVMLTPYDGGIYASDPTRLKTHPEFVYLGRPSFDIDSAILTSFAGHPASERGGRLLDLGCGCGNIGIAVASRFDEIVGTDIVERCLTFSRLNAAVAEVTNCTFTYSNLFDDVEGTFDVVVANTPGGWIDPDIESARTYSTGGAKFGGELPQRMLAGACERLEPDGRIYALLTAPVIGRRPYVVDLLEEIFGRHEVGVTLYPLFEEFNTTRARLYRSHGIRKMVRYMTVLERRQGPFEIRFEQRDAARLWSYRLRAGVLRSASRITGRAGVSHPSP